MALKRIQEFSKNVAVHQQLGDNPNTDDNLSASELKATFDRPAEDIKEYVNGTLVPAIQELEEYGDSVSADLSDKGKEITEIKQAVIGAQGSANQAAFNAAQAAGMAEEAASASRDASAAASAAQTAAETASTDASMAASDAEAATQAASAAQAAADQANANAERAAERAKQAEAAAASAATEASKAVKKSGDSMSGPLSMEGNKLTGLPDPSNDGDAVSKGYLNTELSRIQGAPGPYYTPTVTNPTPGLLHIEFGKSLTSMPDIPGVDVSLPSGEAGDDGGYYIPKISQTGINTMQMGFDPSKPGMTSVQPRQIVLPKGDPGSAAIGLGGCNSAASAVNKEISIFTDDFKPTPSAIVTVAFNVENTADNPSLVINNRSYGVIDCRNGNPVKAAAMCGQAHTYVLDAQNGVAFLVNPSDEAASGASDAVESVNGQTGAVKVPVPGCGTCASEASSKEKEVGSLSAGFDPTARGAVLTVKFENPGNTVNGASLTVANKSYPIVDSRTYALARADALAKKVHHFVLIPGTAILLDPSTTASSATLDKTLTQEGSAADAKAAGDAIKNLREFLQGDVELTSLNLTAGLTTDADINVDFGGNRLRGVNDPVEDTDAASKGYVDEQIANISNDGNAAPSAGVCTTVANVAAKVEQGYIKSPIVGGSIVTVEFTNDNTAKNPTLDVNGVVGAIVYRSMSAIDPASLTKGIHQFVCLENYNKWIMLDALEWEEIANITVEADVQVVAISKDKDNKPFGLRKAKIMVSAVGSETNTKSANGELRVNGITYYYSPNLPVVGAETSRFIASSLEAITDGLIWHDSSSNNNNTYQATGTRHTGWIATVESTLRHFAFSAVGGMVIGAGTNIKIMGVRA